MSDIGVSKVNNTFLRLDCSRGIAMEMNDYFSFFVTGYQFMPKFKQKMWDGKIRLFNLRSFTLPVGLFAELQTFARKSDYVIDGWQPEYNSVSITELTQACKDLNPHAGGVPITHYSYQIQAVKHFIENRRLIIESPTSCLDPDTKIKVQLDDNGIKELRKIQNHINNSS